MSVYSIIADLIWGKACCQGLHHEAKTKFAGRDWALETNSGWTNKTRLYNTIGCRKEKTLGVIDQRKHLIQSIKISFGACGAVLHQAHGNAQEDDTERKWTSDVETPSKTGQRHSDPKVPGLMKSPMQLRVCARARPSCSLHPLRI